ncbi:MAG: hypothetical protein SFZ03_08110 [Candidatus Melainabacteria bacterium]|nr:hypothetical protein [Candidatus Melainabacteria bacterium]
MGMLAPIIFNPVSSRLYSILDGQSMLALVARDGLDSFSRIQWEMKRSKLGGQEQIRTEVLTALIWGFGMKVQEAIYDGVAKMGGFTHTDLSHKIFNDKVQKLTPDVVKNCLKPEAAEKLLKVLETPFPYGLSWFGRLLFAAVIPACAIGFGVPRINHYFTRMALQQEQAHTAASTQARQPVPFSTQAPRPTAPQALQGMPPLTGASPHAFALNSPFLPLNGTQPNLAGVSMPPLASAGWMTNTDSPFNNSAFAIPAGRFGRSDNTAPDPSLRFGAGVAEEMMKVLHPQNLLSNEKTRNLYGIDAWLSGGRIITARNWKERLEWTIREGIMVFMLFVGTDMLNNMFKQGIQKMFGTAQNMGLDFKVFEQVQRQFTQNGKTNLAAFQQQYGTALKHLLGEHEADIAKAGSVEKFLESLEGQAGEKETKILGNLVTKARQYFSQHQIMEGHHFKAEGAQRNLILDLAAQCDHIPIQRPFWYRLLPVATPKLENSTGILLHREVDTEGMSALIKGLERLKLAADTQGEKAFTQLITHSRWGKLGALFFAYGTSFLIMGNLIPWIQHAVTRMNSGGRDIFPGIEGQVPEGSLSTETKAPKKAQNSPPASAAVAPFNPAGFKPPHLGINPVSYGPLLPLPPLAGTQAAPAYPVNSTRSSLPPMWVSNPAVQR